MKLTRLIYADIHRDGGSLSAAFETESDGTLSFFLQIARDEKRCPIYGSYGDLFVCEGEYAETSPPARLSERGGAEEAAVVEALDELLRDSALTLVQNDSGEKWHRLKQIFDALQRRKLPI